MATYLGGLTTTRLEPLDTTRRHNARSAASPFNKGSTWANWMDRRLREGRSGCQVVVEAPLFSKHAIMFWVPCPGMHLEYWFCAHVLGVLGMHVFLSPVETSSFVGWVSSNRGSNSFPAEGWKPTKASDIYPTASPSWPSDHRGFASDSGSQ